MLIGGMVHHHVKDYLHAAFVRFVYELLSICKCTVLWRYICIVRYIIAEISLRAFVERREPDRLVAKRLDIVQLLYDAGYVAYAIAIAVIVGTGIYLVDGGAMIPGLMRLGSSGCHN